MRMNHYAASFLIFSKISFRNEPNAPYLPYFDTQHFKKKYLLYMGPKGSQGFPKIFFFKFDEIQNLIQVGVVDFFCYKRRKIWIIFELGVLKVNYICGKKI